MTERKTHLDTLAISMLVFCCFLWGLNQVAAKAAMPEVPALWQYRLEQVRVALVYAAAEPALMLLVLMKTSW